MNMNVKSPSPPFTFFVEKCDPPSRSSYIYSDPPPSSRQKWFLAGLCNDLMVLHTHAPVSSKITVYIKLYNI